VIPIPSRKQLIEWWYENNLSPSLEFVRARRKGIQFDETLFPEKDNMTIVQEYLETLAPADFKQLGRRQIYTIILIIYDPISLDITQKVVELIKNNRRASSLFDFKWRVFPLLYAAIEKDPRDQLSHFYGVAFHRNPMNRVNKSMNDLTVPVIQTFTLWGTRAKARFDSLIQWNRYFRAHHNVFKALPEDQVAAFVEGFVSKNLPAISLHSIQIDNADIADIARRYAANPTDHQKNWLIELHNKSPTVQIDDYNKLLLEIHLEEDQLNSNDFWNRKIVTTLGSRLWPDLILAYSGKCEEIYDKTILMALSKDASKRVFSSLIDRYPPLGRALRPIFPLRIRPLGTVFGASDDSSRHYRPSHHRPLPLVQRQSCQSRSRHEKGQRAHP